MIQRLLTAGLIGYVYGKRSADPARRPNLLAALSLQEERGGETLAQILEAKQQEIPDWLCPLLERHIQDEARHARIFARAVEHEGYRIDREGSYAQKVLEAVGEGSTIHFHKAESLAEIPLSRLLAGILLAEEGGVRLFKVLIRSLPQELTATRAGVQSVLQDEIRHVRYLNETLQRLGDTQSVEEFRQLMLQQILADFGKIFERMRKNEEGTLVQPFDTLSKVTAAA
jgi:rubrerythrin